MLGAWHCARAPACWSGLPAMEEYKAMHRSCVCCMHAGHEGAIAGGPATAPGPHVQLSSGCP